jgi:chromosomal replication initiation ATPase DnaA
LYLSREGRAPTGAGRVPVSEPEPPELVVWHEFLDQREELSLLKPDVCVQQLSRRIQRLSIDDAGSHGDVEFASKPLELHVLDACLAEGSRLRPDVPEEKREELFFLTPKWTRSSFLKNSTNSLAVASRAEASLSAAWRSRNACMSPL